MAAGNTAKQKAASRKVKDKWKAKEWYNIHAPRLFNEAVVGETPAIEPETLIGRTTEGTVQELSGDFSKMHIKMKFRIVDTDGHEAKTEFIGHELTSEYVRRLTRRKKTKTDHVVDVITKDKYTVRLKLMSIADKRIQSSQEEAMRRIMNECLTKTAEENNLSEIVKMIITGELPNMVRKECRVIMPVKRIEIRKSVVLSNGEGEPESIVSIFEKKEQPVESEASEAAAEEAPAEEATEEPVAEAAEEAKPAEE